MDHNRSNGRRHVESVIVMSSEGKSEVRGRRFLRRSDQAALALLLVVAIASLGIRWFRAGGPTGHLVNADERLAANLSPRAVRFVVDINTADVAELGELPQVGPMLARRLIEHRERNGRFRSFDDLLQVKGIGRKTLEVLRPHVRFD